MSEKRVEQGKKLGRVTSNLTTDLLNQIPRPGSSTRRISENFDFSLI